MTLELVRRCSKSGSEQFVAENSFVELASKQLKE
jgi:hypothetical protein